MKYLFTNFIIGFTCEVFILTEICANNNSLCDITTETGFLMANCSGRQLADVPQDLNPNIEFLFLMNNTFQRLNETSFARYPNLILLSLQNTTYLNQIDPINYYTFRPLTKLELLLLNEISTPFNFSFHWPPSLRLISVNHNKFISDMDFSELQKLQDLHALTYSLRDFPKFNFRSPLTFLDLRGNPMDSLSAEDLAPFCTLDFLSLEWPQDAVINGSERFCQCLRLENWINKFNIGSNGPLNCTPPNDTDVEECSLEYSEDVLSDRRNCLSRRLMKSSVSLWFWVISCVILVCPLIILTFRETRAHQRSILRSTPTTRKSGKFPNVELVIDVDEHEDFIDEAEADVENFDVNLFGHDLSKIDKKTSLHIEQDKKIVDSNDLRESKLQESSRIMKEEEDEEEEEEEEEEVENDKFGKNDGKFKIKKSTKTGPKPEKQKKNIKFHPQKSIENKERKPLLQVKPREDFEDEFDVDLPKYEKERERREKMSPNRRKPALQVETQENLPNQFSAESPKKEQSIELTEEKINHNTTKMNDENKFSPASKSEKNFEERLSEAVAKYSPSSVEIINKNTSSNCEKSSLRESRPLLRCGCPVISVEGKPKWYESLDSDDTSLETSDTQSVPIVRGLESIENVKKDDSDEGKNF